MSVATNAGVFRIGRLRGLRCATRSVARCSPRDHKAITSPGGGVRGRVGSERMAPRMSLTKNRSDVLKRANYTQVFHRAHQQSHQKLNPKRPKPTSSRVIFVVPSPTPRALFSRKAPRLMPILVTTYIHYTCTGELCLFNVQKKTRWNGEVNTCQHQQMPS